MTDCKHGICWYPACDCFDKKSTYRNEPVRANPPSQEGASLPMDPISVLTDGLHRLSREQIKQEIRELDALRMEHASLYMDAIVYYRINELLDMLDNENG